MLTQDEQQQLASAFAEVDAQKIGDAEDKRLLQIAENLGAQAVGVASR